MLGKEEQPSGVVVVDLAYNDSVFSVAYTQESMFRCQSCRSLFMHSRCEDHARWHLNRQKEIDAAKAIQSGGQ